MKDNLLYYMKKYTVFVIFAALFIGFSIIAKGFFSATNFLNIIHQNAIYGVMCIGGTFIILNGYRDLSVGMVMALSAVLTIYFQSYNPFLGMLLAVLMALAVGFINGILVAKVGINSFIVTLATMRGVRSIVYMITKEQTLPGRSEWFPKIAATYIGGISLLVIICGILMAIGGFVLTRTAHGRNTYAVGGNADAAKNAGINADRTTIINFMVCAFTAAIGGILTASRMNSAMPELGWPDTHFMVIVMVVLGGTKLSGGYGNLVYTIGGVLTIGILQNFLNMMNINAYWNYVATGLMLIIVLYMDKIIKPTAYKQKLSTDKKGEEKHEKKND